MTTERTKTDDPMNATEDGHAGDSSDENQNLDPQNQNGDASGDSRESGTDGDGDEKSPRELQLEARLKAATDRNAALARTAANDALTAQIDRIEADNDRAEDEDLAAVEAGDMKASEARRRASDRKTDTKAKIKTATEESQASVMSPEQATMLTNLEIAVRLEAAQKLEKKYPGIDVDVLVADTSITSSKDMEVRARELSIENREKKSKGREKFDGNTGSAVSSDIEKMDGAAKVRYALRNLK